MDAILVVDLEAGRLAVFHYHFINPCRAIALGGFGPHGQIYRNRNAGVLQFEMGGLIFLMIGGREGQIGEPVKGQHAIGLGIVNNLAIAAGFRVALSGLPCFQVPKPKPNSVFSHISTAPRTTPPTRPSFDHMGFTFFTRFRSS